MDMYTLTRTGAVHDGIKYGITIRQVHREYFAQDYTLPGGVPQMIFEGGPFATFDEALSRAKDAAEQAMDDSDGELEG
jgi:hypothetical protein